MISINKELELANLKPSTPPQSTEREAHRVIIVALLMHYRNRHVFLYHEERLTKATTKQNIAMPPNNFTTLTQSNSETTTSTLLSFSLFFGHSSVAYDHFRLYSER